jgi:hypothetical protein
VTFGAFLQRHIPSADIRSNALPAAIELVLLLAHGLEPRFSASQKGWLDGLRGVRNDIVHGGFIAGPGRYDPADVHEQLVAILAAFAPPPANE